MKAKLAASLPIGEEWLYELRLGGYRFLATKGGDAVHLWSRTEHDLSARFPHIVEAVQALPCDTAIFDGELIVPHERGCPSFQRIQNASEETPVQAFVFDLLQLDGDDLRRFPLEDRSPRLAPLLNDRALHISPELKGDAEAVFAAIAERDIEGIVAKRRASRREPGRGSG